MSSYEETQVLYYYNGTAMPITTTTEPVKFMRIVRDTVEKAIRAGVSMQQIKKEVIEDLTLMEGLLYKFCNPSTEEGINKVAKEMGLNVTQLITRWTLAVCTALVTKAIADDKDNGISMTTIAYSTEEKEEKDAMLYAIPFGSVNTMCDFINKHYKK